MGDSLIRDGLPLWPLSLEKPEAWAGWTPRVRGRVFRTPFGAVLSLVATFEEDVSGSFQYATISASDPEFRSFLEALEGKGRLRLLFLDPEGREHASKEAAMDVADLLAAARAYDAARTPDPVRAVEAFKAAFVPQAGWKAGWSAADEAFGGPARKAARALALLASPYLAVAALSYLFAGRPFWFGMLIVIGIFSGWGVLSLLKESLGVAALTLVFGTSLILLGAWIGDRYAIADVYVDNYSGQAVRVDVDGLPWPPVEAGKTVRKQLRRGPHEVVVRSAVDGREIERRRVEVKSRRPHVYNVQGRMSYTLGKAEYGYGVSGGSGRRTHSDPWFEAAVDLLFENPPASIEVSSKSGGGSRSYLVRNGVLPP